MFETGIRQLRMAFAMATGRPIDPANVRRLIGDALTTLRELGSPGDDLQQLLDGPFADPAARHAFQEQALRRTVRRLARRSPYYRELLAAHGLDPAALTLDALASIPVTTKRDLVAAPERFIADGAEPVTSTRTTGTTGAPAEVWLSRYELELWPALAALSGLLRDEIRPSDHMQINISSRAVAAVHQSVTVCRLVGARCRPLGLVGAEEGLAELRTGPTLLSTYPSYLAELVKAAHRAGLGPDDFRLRRIDCGGEILSSTLARAARDTLGAPVNDTFAMTEVLPVSGRVCEQGHLHHDLNMGLVEIVSLDGSGPAAPGELGTVVITPFYPYRECMPVLRYDTRDVVRRLPDAPLECSLAGIPACSRILGKADDPAAAVARELVEALEALPGTPWPARFAVRGQDGGRWVEVSAATAGGVDAHRLGERLRAATGDQRLGATVVDAPVRRVRADLLETTFTYTRG
jgi:phenylacetate-coenzyme A ligase PaaK-like adenylate-forming protein